MVELEDVTRRSWPADPRRSRGNAVDPAPLPTLRPSVPRSAGHSSSHRSPCVITSAASSPRSRCRTGGRRCSAAGTAQGPDLRLLDRPDASRHRGRQERGDDAAATSGCTPSVCSPPGAKGGVPDGAGYLGFSPSVTGCRFVIWVQPPEVSSMDGLAAAPVPTTPLAAPGAGPAAVTGLRLTTHVVLPAYNEAASLPPLLDRLARVAADRAGHDRLGRRRRLRRRHRRDRRGRVAGARRPARAPPATTSASGQAVQSGLRAVLDAAGDDDVVVVMDADDTHDPRWSRRCGARSTDGADVAICSRFVAGGDDSTAPGVPAAALPRRRGAVPAALLRLDGVHDFTSGFRAYRVSLLARAARHWGERLIEEQGFACMVELLLKLRHCRPVSPRCRWSCGTTASRARASSGCAARSAVPQAAGPRPADAGAVPRAVMPGRPRVVVVGGGICRAHDRVPRTAAPARRVDLLESSDQLGGLGTFFRSQDLGRALLPLHHADRRAPAGPAGRARACART